MAFVSKAQARFLFSQKPTIAKEFAEKTKNFKKLPEKVKQVQAIKRSMKKKI